MHRSTIKTLRPTTIAPLVASLALLGLGACGSSGGGSSNGTSTPAATQTTAEATPTTATTPTTPTTTTGTTSTSTTPSITTRAQFVAVYNCLKREGIKLPPITELGGKNKVNTNTPQFKAAQTKCLREVLGPNAKTEETSTTPTTPTSTTPTATTTTPETKPVSVARRRELASEVARCLRKYGGQVAEPGPEGYLKLEGAPTKTPQFKAAVQKCHSVIVKAFAEAAGKKG